MLITHLTSGRVVAAVMKMGVLTTIVPVRDLRDFIDGAADGRVGAGASRPRLAMGVTRRL